jgi:hypothetical protein
MPPETTSATDFSFDPFLPVWLIVAAGILLIVPGLWNGLAGFTAGWNAAGSSGCYCSSDAWLYSFSLWMLAVPTLVTTWRRYQKKEVAVLVDTSAVWGWSMRSMDRECQPLGRVAGGRGERDADPRTR